MPNGGPRRNRDAPVVEGSTGSCEGCRPRYRAVDQYGQIIDELVSARRDLRAARRFFARALSVHGEPTEIVTDRAPAPRAAIEGHTPAAFHNTTQYANNRVECDHGRLKARLRPMRGLKRDHSARVIMRGHALMQNIRRGRYELGIDARAHRRIEHAFTELARTIEPRYTTATRSPPLHAPAECNSADGFPAPTGFEVSRPG